jgi:hypothetical protein
MSPSSAGREDERINRSKNDPFLSNLGPSVYALPCDKPKNIQVYN